MSDDARREQSAPSSSTAAPSSSTAASPAAGADARRQQLRKAQAARTTTPRRRGPMGRGPAQTMATEKPRDPKGSLLKLLRYLGGHRRAVVVVIIFAIASTLFMILGPKILGTATTELFSGIMAKIAGTGDGPDFSAIAQTLLFLCGLYLISALFQFVQGFLMTGVANKICYQLRRDLDEKIMRLPFSYYDKVATGDVMSRITNDVDAIQQCLNQSITQLITSVTTLLGILVMMLSISWAMTLIALVTLPLSAGIVMLIIRRSQRHFVAQQDYLGEVNGMVEENFATHTIVRAFNGERQALEQFSQSNNRLYAAAWRANFLSGMMMPVMNIISNLGYVAVCLLGGWLAIQRGITVGDIQAFMQYMRQFSQPIMQISQMSNVVQQALAGAERIFNFLAEEDLSADPPPDERSDPATVTGAVCFNQVRFGYAVENPVIHNFTACAAPGQKIAIVGPTGAGKTTIVKLLMRFYDVDAGSITLDGHDIRSFARDDLRSLFGMVLQDTWLYSGSIADNIRYGHLEASDEEVRAAARVAQADRFISTLPDGYNLVLNEEASNVSQGQKQLLTIARAVLHDPRILILDEATSSVDTRTELLIQKAMDNLMAGRTSFIIAHRLSTIRNADLILVIKDGDIVEQGTHAELLAKDGAYAALYNAQFEGQTGAQLSENG